MDTFTKHIVGKKVLKTSTLHGNYGLDFEGGSGITIYNCILQAPENIIGQIVVDIKWHDGQNFNVIFSNGDILSVGLDDDSVNGPEVFFFSDNVSGAMIIEQN